MKTKKPSPAFLASVDECRNARIALRAAGTECGLIARQGCDTWRQDRLYAAANAFSEAVQNYRAAMERAQQVAEGEA